MRMASSAHSAVRPRPGPWPLCWRSSMTSKSLPASLKRRSPQTHCWLLSRNKPNHMTCCAVQCFWLIVIPRFQTTLFTVNRSFPSLSFLLSCSQAVHLNIARPAFEYPLRSAVPVTSDLMHCNDSTAVTSSQRQHGNVCKFKVLNSKFRCARVMWRCGGLMSTWAQEDVCVGTRGSLSPDYAVNSESSTRNYLICPLTALSVAYLSSHRNLFHR